MKRLLLILVLFISLLGSCKKKEILIDYSVTGYTGQIQGLLLNGAPWVPVAGATALFTGIIDKPSQSCNYANGRIQLETSTPRPDPIYSDVLEIFGIPLKPGKYFMTGPVVYSPCDSVPDARLLSSVGGDAELDDFERVPGVENSVTIISYDTLTGDVKGTFDITLANTRKSNDLNHYPNILHFSGGQFQTKWIK